MPHLSHLQDAARARDKGKYSLSTTCRLYSRIYACGLLLLLAYPEVSAIIVSSLQTRKPKERDGYLPPVLRFQAHPVRNGSVIPGHGFYKLCWRCPWLSPTHGGSLWRPARRKREEDALKSPICPCRSCPSPLPVCSSISKQTTCKPLSQGLFLEKSKVRD